MMKFSIMKEKPGGSGQENGWKNTKQHDSLLIFLEKANYSMRLNVKTIATHMHWIWNLTDIFTLQHDLSKTISSWKHKSEIKFSSHLSIEIKLINVIFKCQNCFIKSSQWQEFRDKVLTHQKSNSQKDCQHLSECFLQKAKIFQMLITYILWYEKEESENLQNFINTSYGMEKYICFNFLN